MTVEKKQSEIAVRITRLSEIRADLMIARRRHEDGLTALAAAGKAVNIRATDQKPSWTVDGTIQAWPTKVEVDENIAAIEVLKNEAGAILEELKDLDVDSALFKLNGD